MQGFILRSYIGNHLGYGLHGLRLLQDFVKFGYSVDLRPITCDFRDAGFRVAAEAIPAIVPQAMGQSAITNQNTLLLALPYEEFPKTTGMKVHFTMWENSRVSKAIVDMLNTADHVVVPCSWNADVFNACGVNTKISINPLGIDTEVYSYREPCNDGLCVFGAGGRISLGGERKNLTQLITSFLVAFPREKDVRLRLKVMPGDIKPKVDDSRIELCDRFLSLNEMAAWYSSLTVYVSTSYAEGWGLMPHQAMGVGRAVLAPAFGGMREYFDASVGFPLDFRLVPCRGYYAKDEFTVGGHWAEVDDEELVSNLRWIYQNVDKAKAMGKVAAKRAAEYSWSNSHQKLRSTLLKIGFLHE